MTTKTVHESPLEGMLVCGNCRMLMVQESWWEGDVMYRCSATEISQALQCPFPQVDAISLDNAVLKEVLLTLLTDRLQSRLISQLDQFNAMTASVFPNLEGPEDVTRQEIRDMLDYPEEFIKAVKGPSGCSKFLQTFIRDIEVHRAQAIVNYRLKLPTDSRIPNQDTQVIQIPEQPAV